MSDSPQAVIARIMREHQPKQVSDNKSRPGFRIWHDGCSGCDWIGLYTGTDYESFTVHVAAIIAEALGLAKSSEVPR